MPAPPGYKKFSPLRFDRFKGTPWAEDLNRVQDLIGPALDALNLQTFKTYAFLPPGAAPGTPAGGGSGGPWVQAYAKPNGAESNDGLSWPTAKKYGISAAEIVVSRGGGTINYADNTQWGGPVAKQGPWFRNDGLNVPGYLQHVPLILKGSMGPLYSQFAFAGAARMIGGGRSGDGRFLPFVSLVRTSFPTVIQGILPNNDGIANNPYRIGWDFARKLDGTPNLASITTWARASGSANVVVSLPPGIPITAASRTGGNIVTLTFASTAPLPIPVSRGDQQWIHVTSTDANFPSGDKQLFATNGVNTIQYTEAGANVSGGAIGSWASHGICARDRIEVVAGGEVPSTMYRVSSVSNATTFTVDDPYGFAPRSPTITVNNPGQYVVQDRFNQTCSVTTQINNQGGSIINSSLDTFEAGPTFDYGGSSDARSVLMWSAFSGGYALNDTPTHFADLDRAACIFADGGASGSPALVGRDLRPSAGGIRIYPSQIGTSAFDFDRVIPDINIVVAAPPVVEVVNGTQAYFMRCTDCVNTDNIDPSVPNVKADLALYSKVTLDDCGLVQIDQGGALLLGTSGSINGDWAGSADLPIKTQMYGFGPGGRVQGITSASFRRLGGMFSPRFRNLIADDSSTWPNGIGATVTPGQTDPNGGTQAVKITGTGLFRLVSSPVVGNAVGDRWVICGLVRKDGGFPQASAGHEIFHVNQVSDNGPWQLVATVPYTGDGDWQPAYAMFKLATVNTVNDNTLAYCNVVNHIYVYHPTLVRIPVSLGMSDDEAWDWVTTNLDGWPAYLVPGMSGTDIGRPFIAHGGLGTLTTNATNPSAGASKLSKVFPLRAEDGTAVLGYMQLHDSDQYPGLRETGGPTVLTYGAIPDSNPDVTVLTRPAGASTVVGTARMLLLSGLDNPLSFNLAYNFQDYVVNNTNAWINSGPVNSFNADGAASEYVTGIVATRCRVLVYINVNSLVAGGVGQHDITLQATRNGSNITSASISGLNGGSSGVFDSGLVTLTGGALADTFGLHFVGYFPNGGTISMFATLTVWQ